MKCLAGWGIATGMAMASAVFAQAPASAPVAFAAASAAIRVNRACAPRMPQRAMDANAQGTSSIRFHVDETGKATGAEITRSAGRTREHRLLDEAAMQALAQCPFVPARDANGQPVASDTDVNFTWRIH